MNGLSGRDVEVLRQLASFAELLRDPKKFSDLVDAAVAASKQYEEYVAAYTTVKQANQYFADIQGKANTVTAKADAVRQEAAALLANAQEQKKASDENKATVDQEIRVARDELVTEQRALADAKKIFAIEQDTLIKQRQQLEAREAKLVTAEQALKARVDQVAKIAAG